MWNDYNQTVNVAENKQAPYSLIVFGAGKD